MASNVKAAAAQSQYSYTGASPLDQIVNGSHSKPSRNALLDRAVTLTRKTNAQNRSQEAESSSRQQNGIDNYAKNYRGEYAGNSYEENDDDSSYGYAYGEPGQDDMIAAQPGSSSNSNSSRQRVLDLRAGRLDQQRSIHGYSNNTSSYSQSPSLLNNAFRDSVASDTSFYGTADGNGQFSVHQEGDALRKDSDRIAEAVQNLALRRRQSIDTVRSSEFGEGGKWDRAWGGSDDDDDVEDDYEQGFGMNHGHTLDDVVIDGKTINGLGVLSKMDSNQWRQDSARRMKGTYSDPLSFPALQDASGVEHVVNLIPSTQRTKQRFDRDDDRLGDASGSLTRRDTMMSVAGDVGQMPLSASSLSQQRDSVQTIRRARQDSRQSISSTTSNPNSNAHVYVWPPTPAASEDGGSSEGKHENSVSKRDALQAYTPGRGIGQRAKVEYMEADQSPLEGARRRSSDPNTPISPSAALAEPLNSPFFKEDGRTRTASGNAHPTGRLPPQPPTSTLQEGRYSDPNQPLPVSSLADLGAARRRAVAEHQGRDSLVSDLDVETLRLDGNSEYGDDWSSRRGSTSSVGSFSSDKIRDQRQRRSQASTASYYSQATDKRSSNGTIRETPSRDALHRSWNGATMRNTSQPSPQKGDGALLGNRGTPKRSNTGPDSYQTDFPLGQQQQANHWPHLEQRPNSTSQPTNGSSLTFSTPKVDRSEKKPSVAVKGALNDSPAEKFLTLAITHHESGDLSRSAYYFERSAKVEGGCIVGMCMWGMALREGWGVRKDQKKGFEWISRAATKAGELMETGSQNKIKSEAELKAIRSELKLSVYELGKCFCYGWGVKMDKPMSLEYFELAAKLGDADAQAEAGALLAAGKGCKKDLKKAAMYYRMAEAQGYDTVGLSWIHKDKYDP